MKTIEQLQAEQAKQIEALQRQHAIASALPRVPDFVHLAGRLQLPDGVSYKVKGIRGALEVFKLFTVVPFGILADSCTSLTPVELVADDKRDRVTGDYAAHLSVNYHAASHCGAGASAKLAFFARVEPFGIISVSADIEGPDYIGGYHKLDPMTREERDSRGRVTARNFTAPHMLNGYADKFIVWGTGEVGPLRTWSNIDYLFCADQCADLPGAEQSHAVGQLVNMADELEPIVEGGE